MPPSAKQQKQKNAAIQKEQQQLLRIEKELKSILNKINDSINVLKVEELQLKSNAVTFESPSRKNQNKFNSKQEDSLYYAPSSSCQTKEISPPPDLVLNSDQKDVNQQQIDLDIKRFIDELDNEEYE